MKVFVLSNKPVIEDLRLIFGTIVPLELPVGNKKLIDLIYQKYHETCKEIIFFSPKIFGRHNYNFHTSDTEVSSISFFEILKHIVSTVKDERPFIVLAGDTLIDLDISTLADGVYVGANKYNYNWDIELKTGLPIVGLFCFRSLKNKELLLQAPSLQEYLNALPHELIHILDESSWKDFGHLRTYYKNRIDYLETRSFNALNYEGEFLLKSSDNLDKLSCEYRWLNFFQEKYPQNIPTVSPFLKDGVFNGYYVRYLNMNTFSEIFVFGQLESSQISHYLNLCKNFLQKLRRTSSECYFEGEFYLQKIQQRRFDIINFDESAGEIIDFLISFFTTHEFSNIVWHGDFCFSNILYDVINDDIVVIDPRACDSKTNFSLCGPLWYDEAKLAHSFVYGYDQIIYNLSIPSLEEINNNLSLFIKIFNVDETTLKIIALQLFITMIPLHIENEDRCKCFMEVSKIIFNSIKI
jgi:hypothetical protein